MKKIPKYIYVLFIVSFLLFIPALIFHGIHGDDGTFHFVNIMAMKSNSSLFQLPTRIRPLTANDLGYGSGIFYPQLIHLIILYIWKVLAIVHLPVSVAVIVFLFFFTFITGIFMRKLLYALTKKDVISTFGSIMYITYPYFIADIYRRNAYGEIISFLSLPIILLGIYYLLYKEDKLKFYLCFVIGFYMLFGSHLISSIYVTLFIGIFLLCQGKKVFKKEVIGHLALASVIAVLLSLDYIVPIFEHKMLGEYMVFQKDYMYSRESVANSVLSIKDLLRPGKWLTSQIPLFIIGLVGFLGLSYKKVKKAENRQFILGGVIIAVVALIMILVPAFWKIAPSILVMTQFAWRNCAYLGFALCLLATFGLLFVPKKFLKPVLIISMILIVVNSVYTFSNKDYTLRKNFNFSINLGGMGWEKEYLPKKAFDDLDELLERDHEVRVVSGEGKVKIIKNNTPYLSFSITTNTNTTVEIPRLYYLWYRISLVDENGKATRLSYEENDKGLIQFDVPKSGVVNVQYQKTLISTISGIISILTWIIFIFFTDFYTRSPKAN